MLERLLINIRGAKGMRDRITILSKDLLDILRQYYTEYHPTTWLFEASSETLHIQIEREVRKRGTPTLVTNLIGG